MKKFSSMYTVDSNIPCTFFMNLFVQVHKFIYILNMVSMMTNALFNSTIIY